MLSLRKLVCDAVGHGYQLYEEQIQAGRVEESGVGVGGVVGGEGGVKGHWLSWEGGNDGGVVGSGCW